MSTTVGSTHYDSFTTALKLATTILRQDRYIRLGCLLKALQKGSTKVKYGAHVRDHWHSFRGVSDAELWRIYEGVLAHLDKFHGPLVCRNPGQSEYPGHSWGYAELSCDNCRHASISPPRMAADKRAFAFRNGHPDAPFWSARKMPNTVWSAAR